MPNAPIDKFRSMTWRYADRDHAALAELRRRVEAAATSPQQFSNYSDIVRGITFRLPNVNEGRPFAIDEWSDLNRSIVGEFLGRIAAESFVEAGCLSSAVVINDGTNGPGEGFWRLLREVGLFKSRSEQARTEFWLEHVALTRAWIQRRAKS